MTSPGRIRTRALVVLLMLAVLAVTVTPRPASAHSLNSSTIAVRLADGAAEATVSVPVQTLDEALGTDHAAGTDDAGLADAAIAYIEAHLRVTGPDGTTWTETSADAERTTIEGVDSLSVVVTLDPGGSGTDRLTITYDAIIEAVPGHEAVVVLTDSRGDISTPGIITAQDLTLEIRDGRAAVPIGDMVRYGLEHVLEGADHLLFLIALLLPAPLMAGAGRWRPGNGPLPTARRVLHVVTAFTIGHSLTLIAAASGWVRVPARPVELLIAASVGVAAVHAIRPLVANGEAILAAAFGLVHGLAFAGILTDLGLEGRTSLVALLAFNLGIELAQLLTVALTLPAIHAISATRFQRPFRVTGATLALIAAVGWGVDRAGGPANALAPVEDVVIAHPWAGVGALAVAAAGALAADRLLPTRRDGGRSHPARHGHHAARPDEGTRPITARSDGFG